MGAGGPHRTAMRRQPKSHESSRFRVLLLGLATLAVLAVPVAAAATVIGSDIYLLGEGQVVAEDLVLSAGTARIEGTIDGDLTIAAGTLELSGDVAGDLTVVSHGQVTVEGNVGGSIRGVARALHVSGSVADDVIVTTVSLDMEGDVGRDLAAWAWRLDMSGEVGRDLMGRFSSATVAGSVGNDVDVCGFVADGERDGRGRPGLPVQQDRRPGRGGRGRAGDRHPGEGAVHGDRGAPGGGPVRPLRVHGRGHRAAVALRRHRIACRRCRRHQGVALHRARPRRCWWV